MNTTLSEERTVLHGITWETYECLLKNYENQSSPRLTFDRGTLEIMAPLIAHEEYNRATHTIVETILDEWGLDYRNLGSSTFLRSDRNRGFEPDTCFYIASLDKVRGKNTLDLPGGDPPPDLVIEIDETHSSIPRMPIMADFGVPEVWRFTDGIVTFHLLANGAYTVAEESLALTRLMSATVNEWTDALARETKPVWTRRIRQWAQANVPPAPPTP